MTFKAYETSARGGKPTRLFVFTRQGLTWRFAEADRDIVISDKTYVAVAISRSEIKETVEKAQDTITITLPYSLDPNAAELPATQEFGNNWRPYIPSDAINVTCLATHRDDPDQEIVVEWMGYVQQPQFKDGQLQLTCAPPGSISAARYQGAKWQVSCWKTVFSTGIRGCNLIAAAIPVAGEVTAIDGDNVTAAAWTVQQRTFTGGTASWTANVDMDHTGTATAIDGSNVTLDDSTGVAVGMALSWDGGSGHVTAVSDSMLTLDNVTGLAINDSVSWTVSTPTDYTANITAYDETSTTITLDDVTGIDVGTQVTANTIPLETSATLTAVAGLTLTAAEFADATLNLAGGEVIWTAPNGLIERRTIVAHDAATVRVLYGAADFAVGLAVIARPACERTWAACQKRNNTINYGGCVYKPITNPYDGQSMSWN